MGKETHYYRKRDAPWPIIGVPLMMDMIASIVSSSSCHTRSLMPCVYAWMCVHVCIHGVSKLLPHALADALCICMCVCACMYPWCQQALATRARSCPDALRTYNVIRINMRIYICICISVCLHIQCVTYTHIRISVCIHIQYTYVYTYSIRIV